MATGFGLRPIGRIGGGAARVREYYIPSTDSTALYVGDVVELVNAMDPKNEVAVVTRATAGNVLLGVVTGFRPDASTPYNTHRAASTNRYVTVCDDPDAIFEVQEDAVGGAVSAASVGSNFNADIIVASGSAIAGSGTMLDSSTAAATTANLKIVGARRDLSNAAAQTAGAILHVLIFEHALRTADSIT